MDVTTRGPSTGIFLCIGPFSAWWHRTNNQVILVQACSWPVRRQSFAIVHIASDYWDHPPENNDMAGCGVLASQDPHVIARGNDSDLKTLIKHLFFKTTSHFPPPSDRYKDWKLMKTLIKRCLTTHLPLLDIDTRITGLHPSRGSTNHRKRIGFQKLVPMNSCWRDCTIFNLVDIFGRKKR